VVAKLPAAYVSHSTAPLTSPSHIVGTLPTPDSNWTQPILEDPFAKFRDWTARYLTAPEQREPNLESEGLDLARTRRQALAQLIRTDPQRALELAVPLNVVHQLPEEIRSQLEERISGRGQLALLGALPQPGKEQQVNPTFRTVTVNRCVLDAYVYGRRLDESTRDDIPFHGIAVDNVIAINENPLRILKQAEFAGVTSSNTDPICSVSGKSANEHNSALAADIGGKIVFLCGLSHALELNDRLIVQDSGSTNNSGGAQFFASPSWATGPKSLLFLRVAFDDQPGAPFPESTGVNLVSKLNAF